MFCHLLEQLGLRSSYRQRDIAAYLEPYIAAQKAQDYNARVVACMAFDARHFAYWVGGNADWNNVDRDVLDRFARHACSCQRALGGRSKRGNGAVRRSAARRGGKEGVSKCQYRWGAYP